ncbi:MAG: hypothetical protein K0R94_1322, partial [Burkholderiales bacterium]|nr:hypothetical protein [Burkholderiales bacterium]
LAGASSNVLAITETIRMCNFLGDIINVSVYPIFREKSFTTKNINLKPYDSKNGPYCQNLILKLTSTPITFKILIRPFNTNTPNKVKISEFKITNKAGTAQQRSKQIEITNISMSFGATAYILGVPTGEGMAYREKPQPQKLENGMALSSLSSDSSNVDQVICLMYRGVNSAPCNINIINK